MIGSKWVNKSTGKTITVENIIDVPNYPKPTQVVIVTSEQQIPGGDRWEFKQFMKNWKPIRDSE